MCVFSSISVKTHVESTQPITLDPGRSCIVICVLSRRAGASWASGPNFANLWTVFCREVVERRAHIVTGRKPTEAEVDNMIDTGESETIFQKAILEQGRGHVSHQERLAY